MGLQVSGHGVATGSHAGTRRVLCAGQIVADLFVPPLETMPEPGELTLTGDMLTGVGGCAANVAVVLARLGVDVGLAAVVGEDGQGRGVRDHLLKQGVDVSRLVVAPDTSTSQTVILPVSGQDRRYIHSIGANGQFSANLAATEPGTVKVVAMGGFLSLPAADPEEVAEVFAQTRASGGRTVLDVVVPNHEVGLKEKLATVLPHVDLFTPNYDEALLLTGESSPEAQAARILEQGAHAVVVTCGGDGALYADAERTLRVLPFELGTFDASGAGDAFTAGMVFGIVHDWDIEQSLRFAAALGASVTRALGTTTSLYTIDEAHAASNRVTVASQQKQE